MGSDFLLHGIFPTQGWNPGLLRCGVIQTFIYEESRPLVVLPEFNSCNFPLTLAIRYNTKRRHDGILYIADILFFTWLWCLRSKFWSHLLAAGPVQSLSQVLILGHAQGTFWIFFVLFRPVPVLILAHTPLVGRAHYAVSCSCPLASIFLFIPRQQHPPMTLHLSEGQTYRHYKLKANSY